MPTPTAGEIERGYDRLHAEQAFESSTYAADLCRRHGPWTGRRVLDVGCGWGDFLSAAKKAGAEVHGLDISPVAIAQARDRLGEADLRTGLAEELPWENETFDWVVCLGSLEHLTDPGRGVAEMRRVARHDGHIYINLPNIYWWRYVIRAWRRGEGPDHFQPNEAFLPRAEWQRLLEENGLRVLRAETWRPRVVMNPLKPLLVVGSLIENLVPPNLANCFGFLAAPRA